MQLLSIGSTYSFLFWKLYEDDSSSLCQPWFWTKAFKPIFLLQPVHDNVSSRIVSLRNYASPTNGWTASTRWLGCFFVKIFSFGANVMIRICTLLGHKIRNQTTTIVLTPSPLTSAVFSCSCSIVFVLRSQGLVQFCFSGIHILSFLFIVAFKG